MGSLSNVYVEGRQKCAGNVRESALLQIRWLCRQTNHGIYWSGDEGSRERRRSQFSTLLDIHTLLTDSVSSKCFKKPLAALDIVPGAWTQGGRQ